MSFQKKLTIVMGLGLGLCGTAHADDPTNVNFGIHHQYEGSRPLGMGDAFVGLANDYNALFYNPAGLARRTDGEVNLSMDFEAGANFLTLQKNISEASSTTGTDSEKESAMFDALSKEYGKALGIRTSLFDGVIVEPKWGFAIIPADLTIQSSFHQSAGPSMNATVYLDTTIAAGYGDDIRGVLPGRLSWGFTGKAINRGFFSKQLSAIELVADSNLIQTSDLREGFGVDGDIGFLYTPMLPREGFLSNLRYTRPTFGLVVRNILQTKFTSSLHLLNKDTTSPPEQLYRVVDIGSKWEYPTFWIFSGRGVLDVRDIGDPEYNARKGLHAGLEFDWSVANWWKGAYRVGYSEGYYTAGVSALFAIFNLDLVTYGEDVGTYDSPLENRIYAARLNINW